MTLGPGIVRLIEKTTGKFSDEESVNFFFSFYNFLLIY